MGKSDEYQATENSKKILKKCIVGKKKPSWRFEAIFLKFPVTPEFFKRRSHSKPTNHLPSLFLSKPTPLPPGELYILLSLPHAVQYGTIRPQSDHLIGVCDVVFKPILDSRKMCIRNPDEFEHFRIKSKSLFVSFVVVFQTLVFPVLTEVHNCRKFLF